MTGLSLPRLAAAIPGPVKRSASIVALLVFWEGFTRMSSVDPFLLPSLSEVLVRGASELWSGGLVELTAITLYRTLVSFLIAGVLGVAIGASMSVSGAMRWFCDPLVSFGFPVPKIAFMPIFVLWFGFFDVSKIVMTTFAAIIPIISATYLGTRGIDRYLLWSARGLGTSERQTFWKVVIPAALPEILSGLQIAFPMCLIVSIVTEMLTGGKGLGGYMIFAARFGESDKVFLGIIAIALVGFVLIEGLAWLRRRLLSWHSETQTTV